MNSKKEISAKKPNIQKDILKILDGKPAVSIKSLKHGKDKKTSYAIARSVKNLIDSGCAEMINSDNQSYIKLTQKGKNKLNNIRLLGEDALVSTNWDGFWRIIILDIPENRKSEREALRYLLKKANFVCIKNTVWISPFPYENLFTNIKKDLNLATELMIVVSDKLDPETHQAFLETIKNK
jgi:DNA-binding transcriptional regulator PaaX